MERHLRGATDTQGTKHKREREADHFSLPLSSRKDKPSDELTLYIQQHQTENLLPLSQDHEEPLLLFDL